MADLALREKVLLVKLLSLTTSDQDGEALSAMRKANSLIKARGLSWEELFSGYVAQDEDPPAQAEQPSDHDEVREAFSILYPDAKVATKFRAFLDDLWREFIAKGELSPGQKAALFRCRDRNYNYQRRKAGHG